MALPFPLEHLQDGFCSFHGTKLPNEPPTAPPLSQTMSNNWQRWFLPSFLRETLLLASRTPCSTLLTSPPPLSIFCETQSQSSSLPALSRWFIQTHDMKDDDMLTMPTYPVLLPKLQSCIFKCRLTALLDTNRNLKFTYLKLNWIPIPLQTRSSCQFFPSQRRQGHSSNCSRQIPESFGLLSHFRVLHIRLINTLDQFYFQGITRFEPLLPSTTGSLD